MGTAIVTLKVKDNVTPELGERFIDLMRTPPGLRSLGWGRTIEEHNTIVGIFNWDSIKAHEDFMKSSAFPPFMARVQAVCISPITIFHTQLQPFPPSEILQVDVVELAVLAKKPGVSEDQFEKVSDTFFERVQKSPGYRCHFRGIKYEDHNVHINFVGWDSMESYVATRSNKALDQLRGVEGLITDNETYVYHLNLQLR